MRSIKRKLTQALFDHTPPPGINHYNRCTVCKAIYGVEYSDDAITEHFLDAAEASAFVLMGRESLLSVCSFCMKKSETISAGSV